MIINIGDRMSQIDYSKLVDEAMHLIVYKILKQIANEGLPGNHHFFISFLTNHPNVKVSDALKNRYPNEMTIVLQYQYEDLTVTNSGFEVKLSFSGTKEKIFIPFAAITTFADPTVQFGLQFKAIYETPEDEIILDTDLVLDDEPAPKTTKKTKSGKGKEALKRKKGEKFPKNVIEIDFTNR